MCSSLKNRKLLQILILLFCWLSKIINIELELPELRLAKKLVLGMVTFILIAFLGVLWNVATKTGNVNDELIKKVVQEYKNDGKR